jgi:putative peptidoglycan lipid II flippase
VTAKVRESDGADAAWDLTAKIATQLGTLMLGIVTMGILFSAPLMESLYNGSPEVNNVAFATDLCRIMWPFIAFASLSALVMGALNIVGVFGLPMIASAVFNVSSVLLGIAFAYCFDPDFNFNCQGDSAPRALYGFAVGVTLGGIAQLLFQLPRLKRAGFQWRLNFKWRDPRVFRIWGLMIPSVMASGVTQFNVFINTGFALELKGGAVAALSTAFKIWQLPVGLFGVATGMVVLPAISRMMVGDGRRDVAEHLAKALSFVSLFALPSMIFLLFLGEDIVSVLYQRGNFTAQDSAYAGQVLASYAVGLLGYAGTKVVQPAFLALEKKWVPLIAAGIALALSYGLNFTFVRLLHKDASWLALTTSCMTSFNFLFYFFYLRKQLGGMGGKIIFQGVSKIVLASLVLLVWCWWAHDSLLADFLSWNFIHRLGMLALVGAVGALIYLAAVWLLRIPELELLRNKLGQRFKAKH